MFTLGINTAYRANELLSITVEQVLSIQAGDTLELKQSKNDKYRRVVINKTAYEALRLYIENDMALQRRMSEKNASLFYSQRGNVLSVPTLTNMVKDWCFGAGCKGRNYGSHTMRKTWGYWQHKRDAPLPLLMEAYGHATQQQTLAYLCIQAEDIKNIYSMEL